jgi:hypothetical protein
VPATIATNAHNPTVTTGKTQPLRQMLTTSNTNENSEITIKRLMAGSCAFTSV